MKGITIYCFTHHSKYILRFKSEPWYLRPHLHSIQYGDIVIDEAQLPYVADGKYEVLGCYDGKLPKGEYADKESKREIDKNTRFEFVPGKKLVLREWKSDNKLLSSELIHIDRKEKEIQKRERIGRYRVIGEIRPEA